MNNDLKTWGPAEVLADVSSEDIRWILGDPQGLFLLFAEVARRNGKEWAEHTVNEFLMKSTNIVRNLTMELTRRAIGKDRAKLKIIAEIKIEELGLPCSYPPGEFIRAFAMRFREHTGMEVTENEMTNMLLKSRMVL